MDLGRTLRQGLVALMLLGAGAAATTGPALAAPGDPDPAFHQVNVQGDAAGLSEVDVLPDLRFVATSGSVFGRTEDGDPDPSYPSFNHIFSPSHLPSVFGPRKVLIDPLGRIVTVSQGGTFREHIANCVIHRFTSDGRLDESFSGDGRAVIRFRAAAPAGLWCEAAALDGTRVVVLGPAVRRRNFVAHFAVARLRGDGVIDRTFFGSGSRTARMGGFFNPASDGAATAVAVDSKHRIIVGGTATYRTRTPIDPAISYLAFARFTPRGRFDRSFSSDGRVVTGIRDAIDVHEILVGLGDGFLASCSTGLYGSSRSPRRVCLVRRAVSGSPDETFGANGVIRPRFINDTYESGFVDYSDYLRDIEQTSDGRVLVALESGATFKGESGTERRSRFVLARFTPRGDFDAAFGGDGRFVDEVGGGESIAGLEAVAMQGQDRILLGGRYYDGSNRLYVKRIFD